MRLCWLFLLIPSISLAEQPGDAVLRACSVSSDDPICKTLKQTQQDVELLGNKLIKQYANEQVAAGALILAKTVADKKVTAKLYQNDTLGSPVVKIGVSSVLLDLKWELP